jgi:hypothetical protein
MRYRLYILTVLVLLVSCKTDNTRTVEGDLYFKLIDFERFFDAPDSVLTKIESSVRTVNKDTLKGQDKKIYDLLQYMIDNNLLRKPFIRLRFDNSDIKIVFLDSSNFVKFKKYNWSDLSRENKKVRVKVSVTELKFDTLTAYNSIKLLSVDKIDGKTYWTK